MPDYFLPKLRPTARIRAFLSTSLLEPHKISRKKVLKEVGKETQLETEAAASSNCVLAFSLLVMFDSDPCFWYFVHVKGIHLLKWTVLPLQSWASFVVTSTCFLRSSQPSSHPKSAVLWLEQEWLWNRWTNRQRGILIKERAQKNHDTKSSYSKLLEEILQISAKPFLQACYYIRGYLWGIKRKQQRNCLLPLISWNNKLQNLPRTQPLWQSKAWKRPKPKFTSDSFTEDKLTVLL